MKKNYILAFYIVSLYMSKKKVKERVDLKCKHPKFYFFKKKEEGKFYSFINYLLNETMCKFSLFYYFCCLSFLYS